jgi:hypothetical protein
MKIQTIARGHVAVGDGIGGQCGGLRNVPIALANSLLGPRVLGAGGTGAVNFSGSLSAPSTKGRTNGVGRLVAAVANPRLTNDNMSGFGQGPDVC